MSDAFEAQIKEAISRGVYGLSGGPSGAVHSSPHLDARNARAIGEPAPPRPPGANAFGALARTHSEAATLADRIVELSDLLCGCEPTPGECGLEVPGVGILPTLEGEANRLRHRLQVAHEAITRIRNHLPPS